MVSRTRGALDVHGHGGLVFFQHEQVGCSECDGEADALRLPPDSFCTAAACLIAVSRAPRPRSTASGQRAIIVITRDGQSG